MTKNVVFASMYVQFHALLGGRPHRNYKSWLGSENPLQVLMVMASDPVVCLPLSQHMTCSSILWGSKVHWILLGSWHGRGAAGRGWRHFSGQLLMIGWWSTKTIMVNCPERIISRPAEGRPWSITFGVAVWYLLKNHFNLIV